MSIKPRYWHIPTALLLILILAGAGCNGNGAPPPSPSPTTTPSGPAPNNGTGGQATTTPPRTVPDQTDRVPTGGDMNVQNIRAKLTAAGLAFTEREADIRGLNVETAIESGRQFKITAQNGNIIVVYTKIKDRQNLNQVKQATEKFIQGLERVVTSTESEILSARDQSIVLISYNRADAAAATRVKNALRN